MFESLYVTIIPIIDNGSWLVSPVDIGLKLTLNFVCYGICYFIVLHVRQPNSYVRIVNDTQVHII
jgi:hypothetical protein